MSGKNVQTGRDWVPHLPAPHRPQVSMDTLIPGWRLAVATIIGEAEGESFEGKVAVGKIIRNRTALGYASAGNIADTVLRPLQFSCWNTQDRRRDNICNTAFSSALCQESYRAWIESEKTTILPDDAVLYHATSIRPGWAIGGKVELISKIGNHLFYRDTSAS